MRQDIIQRSALMKQRKRNADCSCIFRRISCAFVAFSTALSFVLNFDVTVFNSERIAFKLLLDMDNAFRNALSPSRLILARISLTCDICSPPSRGTFASARLDGY